MINRNWIFLIALIPLLSYAGKKGEVDHYRLDYNPDEEVMTLLSCEDESCNNLYESNKTKVKITKDNNNEGNEIYFKNVSNGKDSEAYNANEGTCYPLRLSLKGKSTTPQPSREPGLKCYIKGVPNPSCKFCSDGDSEGEDDDRLEDISVDMDLVGYVGFSSEEAGVRIDNEKINGIPLIIEKIEGEDDNKNVELRDQSGNLLEKGDEFTFPNTLYYNRVGEIEFDLEGVDDQGQEIDVELDLYFVPYIVEVKAPENCPAVSESFNYFSHKSCPVLAKAGHKEAVSLEFIGYGINKSGDGEGDSIKDFSFEIPDGNPVKVNGEVWKNGRKIKFDTVSTVKASIAEHCAAYVPDCGDKTTKASSAIIGRTVPDRLLITAGSGKLEKGIAYRGKKGIAYRGKKVTYHRNDENAPPQSPYFSVTACAAGQKDGECELPSYTGEFAGGLDLYGSLTGELLDSPLQWERLDNGTGKHIWRPDESFAFAKNDPIAEQSLHIPLKLTLAAHDLLDEITANAHFADENDTLRFGFVTLLDTEVKVGEEGKMFSKLHYYGENMSMLREDSDTDYSLSNGSTLKGSLPDDTSFPGLSFDLDNKKVIDIAPYDTQQKGIKVTIEGLPDWLKPVDKDDNLTNPVAILDILSTSRLRATDRTFNRREATR